MKIIDVRHIEDCFDGSFMYEILFDTDVAPAFIQSLGIEGQLQYFPSFTRPFFKAVFENRFTVKGVEGNRSVRILSYAKDLEPTLECLRRLITLSEGAACEAGGEDARQEKEVVESNIC